MAAVGYSATRSFEYARGVQPLPKLGPWRADLDRMLATNEAKSGRERLTLIRLFEELRGLATRVDMTRASLRPHSAPGSGVRRQRKPMCH